MLCELCGTEQASGFHHLIPRTLHTKKWFKKRQTRREMQQGINLCKSCHAAVHDLIPDEKEMGRNYDTKEKLLSHPQVANYVRWKTERGTAHEDVAGKTRQGRLDADGNLRAAQVAMFAISSV